MQKFLLQKFFNGIQSTIPFRIVYWDGTEDTHGEGEAHVTIRIGEKLPVSRFLKEPTMTFAEAYMDGTIDIDGPIESLIQLAYSNEQALWSKTLSHLPKFKSAKKNKQDVQRHYDLGNDFYSLWLDESMSYSCAYFKTVEDTLEQAQLQKIDHTLKKLQLKKGERLLDIGCGWGWLIVRAAQNYGVHATGITLSEEQFRKTQQRIADFGLKDLVDVKLIDYRELAQGEERFDKIASVGMFEHVGQANYPDYMKTVQTLLEPGGLMLLHSITHQKEETVDPWIEKYIFPGGYIPSFREMISMLPNYNFYCLDVENLRPHYARTLDHWAQRFESQLDQVREMYDERFIRMWRLYLQSSAAFFRNGGLTIHQILFSHGINNDLPLTREHLYV